MLDLSYSGAGEYSYSLIALRRYVCFRAASADGVAGFTRRPRSMILSIKASNLCSNQKTLLFPQAKLVRRSMRGKDEQQLDVFSYVSPEQRVPQDHPLRLLRAMTDEALRDLQPRFNKLYAKTGEIVAGAPAAGAVLGAKRTAVDGTTRLQPAVPLVRGLEHGRRHLGCDRVHQEPRAATGWGHCRSLFPSRASAGL